MTKKDQTEPEKAAKTSTKATKRKPKGKSLVIVESPAKARTINKYLGSNFVVKASMGHVRDLPKGKFGIDLEHGYTPEYQPIRGKSKVIGELKKLAKNAETVYLAPDMDREGEAIAWHLFEVLGVPDDRVRRVVFNEITKSAIQEAFREPGRLDRDKVEAQQARRVLDRIMGYKLSPLLWKKIAKGLSAGRVQSVAVRLIVEREKEIRAFVSEEYWRVGVTITHGGRTFQAALRRLGGERVEKNLDEARATELVRRLGGDPLPEPAEEEAADEEGKSKGPERKAVRLVGREALELSEIESKPKTRRPTPPFTTSQLQQKASTLLRFSAKKTMMLAQQLYEGVEIPGEGSVGLITYMRTDSTRVSKTAIDGVRELIGRDFGEPYLPAKPNAFRTKSKGAQEAHEAIRPTDVMRRPQDIEKALTGDQLKLYRLIWNKFVASQMKPARFQVTTAKFVHPRSDAPSGDPLAEFIAQGEVQEFDGHLRVFQADKGGAKDKEETMLPTGLEQGKQFVPDSVDGTQHFTQPPPRYSEATLVKELEKKGIGRPSTYAAIISTIQDRGYVTLEQRRFFATELGEIVTDRLVEHFGDLINTEFTAAMEENLDAVENGSRRWDDVVDGFYKLFSEDLKKAETGMHSIKENPELSEFKCDKCGAPMAVLYNKRGKFLGCSKYPECKNTLPADGVRRVSEVIETDYKCPKCDSPMVIRDGKRGRFLACTAFPKCKSTASVDENGKIIEPKKTGIECDKCGSEMVIKGSRRGPFLACSAYPKCRNAKPLPDELREPPKETDILCEKCGKPMLIKRTRWGKEFLACSGYPECKNARDLEEASGAEGNVEQAGSEA
ncbi:MAG TPA: type I DNA topoisomerase [Planctomycetes bacterium]|nr:type I DNA topoisomerase [Planctomycetota bacterium]